MVGAIVLCAAIIGAEEEAKGPRLADADFFAAIREDAKGLEAVRAAAARGDHAAARTGFAAYLRAREQPYWPLPERPRANLSRARAILAHRFSFDGRTYDLGEDIDWSSSQRSEGEEATLEWNASLNRHRAWKVLADAYRQTGDEAFARDLAAQWLDWIEDCPVLADRSGNHPYHHAWETLNTACRAGDSWPYALLSAIGSPAFTDDALTAIAKSMLESARHLERWPSRGNWLTMESTALYAVGTLLPEFREAARWRRTALARLAGQLGEEIYPDGLQFELALGYDLWVLSNFVKVMELAERNGRRDELPARYLERLERMYDYLLYAARPDGSVPGLNDSRDQDVRGRLAEGARLFPRRREFLFVATGGREGEPPRGTSHAFPYAGHYVMRTGWDPDAAYLLFDAGPFGAGHQHEDKLSFVLYAGRSPRIVEAGTYMYDRSRWRRYVLSSRGHNTIRVDGLDQARRGKRETHILRPPFRPLPNPWIPGERVDVVEGTYADGYGPRGRVDVLHRRAILFVKPDLWIVADRLVPRDGRSHAYESIVHLNGPDADLDEGTKVVRTRGDRGTLWIAPVPRGGLAAEIVRGRREEPVQGWAEGPWRPVPTVLYRWDAAGPATVILAIAFGPGEEGPRVRSLGREGAAGSAGAEIGWCGRRLLLIAQPEPAACRAGVLETDGTCVLLEIGTGGKANLLAALGASRVRCGGVRLR